jgi:hypothetical protein
MEILIENIVSTEVYTPYGGLAGMLLMFLYRGLKLEN